MLFGNLISLKIGKWEGIFGKIFVVLSIIYYELWFLDILIIS